MLFINNYFGYQLAFIWYIRDYNFCTFVKIYNPYKEY